MAATEKNKIEGLVYVKVHRREGEILLAACDEEILGASLEEGKFRINVSVGFYGGRLIGLSGLEKLLSEATIANLIGNRVVDYAISLGYIDSEKVLEVSGVKHAQLIYI